MRKYLVATMVMLVVYAFFWAISSDARNSDSCLDCHGSADKLKSLIKDEDFNKTSGAEDFG